MDDNSKSLATIEDNCKIALANCGEWLKPADTAAISALIRTARLCDALFDAGETKDLAPLLSRLHSIMESLQMTPRSRSDQTLTDTKATPDVKTLTDQYLRLVKPESPDDTVKRPKPRTPSSSTNGASKRTPPRVAKVRPQPRPNDKPERAVSTQD